MKKENSRTKNTIYNFATSMGGQLLSILIHFIVRTVFIKTLGKSYLGINGLFANILTMLSLTEFGVGSAILFKLYDPIAKKDKSRIVILLNFYKNVYRIIGLTITVLGLCLIPMLPTIIKDYNKLVSLNLNVYFIFLLYLAKTVSSYLFFAYKSAIIKADQKAYIINMISYLFTIGGGIAQIIFLLIIPKFEIYITISILQVIFQNIAIAIIANKIYPFITEKNVEKIEKKEIVEIIKDCGAIFLYKLNSVVLKATDNILLSIYIGLDGVALYSNYYVFYTTIQTLFVKIFSSVSHSLGNLHTTHDIEHEYKIFEITNLITAILGGTAFVGVFVVSDELVRVWIGKDWIIPQPFSFLLGLELYTCACRESLGKYRSTMGLFQQAKWRPLFAMVINLATSIVLVKKWGLCGVLVGTILADWSTFMWFDPIIIHRYGFGNYKSVYSYYQRLTLYTIIVLCFCSIDLFVARNIFIGKGWLSVIIHALICGITVPIGLVAFMSGKQEGKYIITKINYYISKFCNHIGKKA